MPIYKVAGTPIQIPLTEEVKDAYTAFQTAISKIPQAQLLTQFKLEGITEKQMELYDKYATMMNLLVELNDGGIDCDLPLDQPIDLIEV